MPLTFRQNPGLRRRVVWLFIASTVLVLVAWVRLAYVQLLKHDFYESEALQQRYRSQQLVPERGTIYDRNGIPLAMTTYVYGVYATPRLVPDAEEAASALAPLLSMPVETIRENLQPRDGSTWLIHRVPESAAMAIENLELPGIYVVQRPHRDYPNGPLAADVLGLTGVDNQGLGGLEWLFEAELKGLEGKFFSERDPRGRAIAGGRQATMASTPAHELILTLDHVLQYITEQELHRGIAAAKASWGAAVMIQPKTGEILSAAVLPSFDPANLQAALPRAYRNPMVADQVEPGSTLKVFTAAAALEEGLVEIETALSSPASLRIGGVTVNNYNHIHHGTISFKDAIALSSNTVFAQLGAQTLGGTELSRYMRAFGFGQRLGVDLPGEATGSVPTPGQVDGEIARWATVSFGQGIAVTPLQLAAATAVLANGGDLMRPHVVREIRGEDELLRRRTEPTLIRRVISSATAADVTEAMQAAVTFGTGQQARVPGYAVAGKTGTAQIPENGVYGDKRLASFIGFAPADDPELALVVLLYDVQQDSAEGGRWAAPVFSAIMARALPHIGVAPSFDP